MTTGTGEIVFRDVDLTNSSDDRKSSDEELSSDESPSSDESFGQNAGHTEIDFGDVDLNNSCDDRKSLGEDFLELRLILKSQLNIVEKKERYYEILSRRNLSCLQPRQHTSTNFFRKKKLFILSTQNGYTSDTLL